MLLKKDLDAETLQSPWQDVEATHTRENERDSLTGGLKTPISFLLFVEILVSVLCSTLVYLSTISSRLSYQQPTTQNNK